MKAKLLVSLLIIGLVAGLIGGATLAWFTDSTEVAPATFTAGTVEVNADGPTQIAVPEGKSIKNVNPGDCATVTWNIVNTGTKAAEFRVKLTELWIAATEGTELSTDNVYYAPAPGSDWVMYTDENNEVWLYYTGGSVPGTFNYVANEDGGSEYLLDERTISLTLVVGFDGVQTDNAYQGATFLLGGSIGEGEGAIDSIVEAVQASNGAPVAVFGDAWTAVNAEDYEADGLAATYYTYFATGVGASMPCWKGDEQEPVKYNLTTEVGCYDGLPFYEREGVYTLNPDGGTFSAGETVDILITTNEGWTFARWETSIDGGNTFTTYGTDGPGSVVGDTYTLNFIMPDSDVILRAVFE